MLLFATGQSMTVPADILDPPATALTTTFHAAAQAPDAFRPPNSASADPVAAVGASGSSLVVARASGIVYRYRCAQG